MAKDARPTRPGNGPTRVYLGLRRMIIGQEFAPGDRLAEKEVAALFDVSRTVVRAALARLAAEGLVLWPDNHSATVASPSLEEARDIFELRQAIEGLVVERLAGKLDEAALARLRHHVGLEHAAAGVDPPETIRLAGEFHVLLAELTGSPLLARYVADLISRSSLLLAATARPHSSQCAEDEHMNLIAKLEKGERKSARSTMTAHLAHIMERALLG